MITFEKGLFKDHFGSKIGSIPVRPVRLCGAPREKLTETIHLSRGSGARARARCSSIVRAAEESCRLGQVFFPNSNGLAYVSLLK